MNYWLQFLLLIVITIIKQRQSSIQTTMRFIEQKEKLQQIKSVTIMIGEQKDRFKYSYFHLRYTYIEKNLHHLFL